MTFIEMSGTAVLVGGNGRTRAQDMAATEPLMKMVVHCIDRIKSFKLSKEVFQSSISCFANLFVALNCP